MHRLLAVLVVVVFVASGCWWPFSGGKKAIDRPAMTQDVSVEVLDPAAIGKGGKIYFMPLSAGADAEAGEALDRLALMIVKGFSDALAEGGGFVLVTGDGVADADVVIRGHVEEFKSRGHFKKIISLKVRADIRSAHAAGANDVIALIYAQRQVGNGRKHMDQAAYDIGYALAKKL